MEIKETGVPKYPDPKPKAPRVPRSYDSILAGALSLPLEERANLRDKLIEHVEAEIKRMQDAANAANKLSNVATPKVIG